MEKLLWLVKNLTRLTEMVAEDQWAHFVSKVIDYKLEKDGNSPIDEARVNFKYEITLPHYVLSVC